MDSGNHSSSSIISVKNLRASFGSNLVVKGISMDVEARSVTAIIGPSGCGKSTFIRCLNRLHEEIEGATVEGEVFFEGRNIYAPNTNLVKLRRRIGMVFQKPNPFPSLSIFENVVVGLRLAGVRNRSTLRETAEKSLVMAALWDEVKDKLHAPATSLSGGQQQRLCIARTLAVEPEVVLMDEPTSALDPISTAKIEELVLDLKKNFTIIIVTHNMQQAARISEKTAFFLLGDLIEYGETSKIFTTPEDERTDRYITGRFG